jgi:hypothetical protein
MAPHDLYIRIQDRLREVEGLALQLGDDLGRLRTARAAEPECAARLRRAEDCASLVRSDLEALARLAGRDLPAWTDRAGLDAVLSTLRCACAARAIEQQREKLRAVAGQMRSGVLGHKLATRKQRLEALRGLAVEQLLAQAAGEQPLALPGPQDGDWLEWAWNLPEAELQALADSLQAELPGLVDFLGECAREWWQPGSPVETPAQTSAPPPEPVIAPRTSVPPEAPPANEPVAPAAAPAPRPEDGERRRKPVFLQRFARPPSLPTPSSPGVAGAVSPSPEEGERSRNATAPPGLPKTPAPATPREDPTPGPAPQSESDRDRASDAPISMPLPAIRKGPVPVIRPKTPVPTIRPTPPTPPPRPKSPAPPPRDEAPAPAAPAVVEVPPLDSTPIDLAAIGDVPEEVKTFSAFRGHYWLTPPLGTTCEAVPWRCADFPDRLDQAFQGALADAVGDATHLGKAWLFTRALELLEHPPSIESRSLEQLAMVWSAPRSPSSGRDPGRLARIRKGEGASEMRLLLFLEAVRPSVEDGLTPSEIDASLERARFHDFTLRQTIRDLLAIGPGLIDPVAGLRQRLEETPAVNGPQDLEGQLGALARKRQALYIEYLRVSRNAGNGYVGRFDFCHKAWAEFLDEITPKVRPLFPLESDEGKGGKSPRGDKEWNVAAKAAWIETITGRHTTIADRYGARDRARRIMDRAAESLADHLREVNTGLREVQELTHSTHLHKQEEFLPVAEVRKLQNGPLSRTDEELCRQTLLHLLRPPSASPESSAGAYARERSPSASPASESELRLADTRRSARSESELSRTLADTRREVDPLVLPAGLLLEHPDLLVILAEDDLPHPRFEDLGDPVRASAVLLAGPIKRTASSDDPPHPLDRLAAWLRQHRRFHLLGRLMTRLSPDDQRAAHRQRDEAMFRVQGERGRLYRAWRDFDDLAAEQAPALRCILDEVDRLTGDGAAPAEAQAADPALLYAWLARIVQEAEGRLQKTLLGLRQLLTREASPDQPGSPGGPSGPDDRLRALLERRFRDVIRLPSETRAQTRRWRETPWRTEAAGRYPNPRALLMQEDLELARDWVQRFPQPPHNALRSLRASFTRWAFGGDTPTSLNKRASGRGDNREYRISCAGIRDHFAAQQPTFLPQLADFADLVVLTPAVLPDSHDFVGRTVDLVNSLNANDLCVVLVPGIPANTRTTLLDRFRRRSGACVAILDDLDLCRLLNPKGGEQHPDPVIGLLELAFEQQSWARLTPFTAAGGDQMRLEMYVGRRDEAGHLASSGKYTRLFSGRKLGKTALLKFLEQTWDGRELPAGQRLRVLYVPIVGVREESDLVQRLINEMVKRFGIDRGELPNGFTAEALVSLLLGFVDQRPEESLLFVLDEADEFVLAQLEEYERRYEACLSFQMRSQISGARIDASQRPRVRFVFSGYRATATYGGSWAHWGDVLQLVPLRPDEAADLVAGPLARLGIDAGEQADAIAFRCGYQPAVLLRFGEELLARLESRRGHHENVKVTADDVAETFHQQPVQDEIRRGVSYNFQSNPLGRAVFAALLLEFSSLPRGQGLRRAEEQVLERLRLIDEDAPRLLRGDDPSALGQITAQFKDFVNRELLIERYEQGEAVYFLKFPYHLSVLLANDQKADVLASLQALRDGAGRSSTEVRGLLPARVLNALREVVRPGPKGPDPDLPCRAAIVGTLWPDAINNRSRGVANSLGLDPSVVLGAEEARKPGVAGQPLLSVLGAHVEDLDAILKDRPIGLAAPLFTGGADLLREMLRRGRRGSDFYEIHGLSRLNLATVRWWFQRVRGLEFPGEADLAEIHRLSGGIPLLVRGVDELLPRTASAGGMGGHNVSEEEAARVRAQFTERLPAIACDLTSGPPECRLTPREIDLLRMVHTVNAALDFQADGTSFEEALGSGWTELYAEEWPKCYPDLPAPEPLLETTEDQVSLMVVSLLGLLPWGREGLSLAARLEPLAAGDPLLGLLRSMRPEP